MHPVLVHIGSLTIYSYGVMVALALFTATWLAARAARRLPPERVAISAEQMFDVTCVALLGGLAGGRLLYVILERDYFLLAPLEILALWHGGLVWYGGFAGGLLAAWGYLRAKRLPVLRVMDQFIPFLALGHAIGRLGCFLNGCCYGKATNSWCGVVFPGYAGPVLPIQLFEAAGLFVLYAILRVLQRTRLITHAGAIFGCYLVDYAVLRFFLEFLRGDQPIWWAGLTLQQLLSVALLFTGLGVLLRAASSR